MSSIPSSVDEYAAAIRQGWQKVTASIFEVAQVCSKADLYLTTSDKKRLFKAIQMKPSTFSKLVRIARDKRLTDEGVKTLLPPSYSTIYELTRLGDSEMENAVAANLLNPDVRREDVIAWRKRKGPVPKRNGFPLYAHIYLKKELSLEAMSQLRRNLDKLCLIFDLKVNRPEDFHNSRASNWGERVLRQMRAEARKAVRRFLKNRAASVPGKKISEVGLLPDEISIDALADEARILEVLQCIGIEDEFEGIRSRAMKMYPMPSPYSYWPPKDGVIDENGFDELRSSRKKKKYDITKFVDLK
jgi:hypothetical protein